MQIVPWVLGIAALVSQVSAQRPVTIAVDGGVSYRIDRRLEGCGGCTPLARQFGGEVAFFGTDSLAVVAGLGWRFLDIDVSADDLRLELDTQEHYASVGLRYYGPPGLARFFGEVDVGLGSLSSTFASLGSRRLAVGAVLNVAPGAGVDIAVNERAAVRIAGGWDIGLFAGEPLRNVGVGAGLVFNVGRQP